MSLGTEPCPKGVPDPYGGLFGVEIGLYKPKFSTPAPIGAELQTWKEQIFD